MNITQNEDNFSEIKQRKINFSEFNERSKEDYNRANYTSPQGRGYWSTENNVEYLQSQDKISINCSQNKNWYANNQNERVSPLQK